MNQGIVQAVRRCIDEHPYERLTNRRLADLSGFSVSSVKRARMVLTEPKQLPESQNGSQRAKVAHTEPEWFPESQPSRVDSSLPSSLPPKKERKTTSSQTTCPADFEPDAKSRAFAIANGVDPDLGAADQRNYWPQTEQLRRDWQQVFRASVLRWRQQKRYPYHQPPPKTLTLDDLAPAARAAFLAHRARQEAPWEPPAGWENEL